MNAAEHGMTRWTDTLLGKPLSPREQDVLARTAEGDDTRATARVLHLAVETVKTYRQKIMGKLGARNMSHAVAIAFRQGLLT